MSLVGHSAGAQMCAMALLHRAKAVSRYKHKQHSISNGQQASEGMDGAAALPADMRMPARFIGMLPH